MGVLGCSIFSAKIGEMLGKLERLVTLLSKQMVIPLLRQILNNELHSGLLIEIIVRPGKGISMMRCFEGRGL